MPGMHATEQPQQALFHKFTTILEEAIAARAFATLQSLYA